MYLEIDNNKKDTELKFTEKSGGYWDGTGVNAEIDKKLWDELVPSRGKGDTVHGELLRCASRIYRDMYNNGGGNMAEFEDNGYSCDRCDYYDEEEHILEHSEVCPKPFVLSEYYAEMFDYLEKHLTTEGRETLSKVKKVVLSMNCFDIPIEFDRLVDHTIHLALITKDITRDFKTARTS